MRSNDRGNHNNNTLAAFGFVSFQKNIFSLNGGGRIQHDENYGTKFLPQASASLHIRPVVLFVNAGRSARSADFTERFNNYNKPVVNSGNIGNPNLDAETGWSYEAGASFSTKSLRLMASAFLRDQEDVIDWVPTPYDQMPRQENLNPGGSFALSKNISTLRTTGIEAEIKYRHSWRKNNITANLSATFLNSNSSQQAPSFYILSHAKTIFQQNFSFTASAFNFSWSSIYAFRNPQQAPAIKAEVSREYFISSLRASYRIRWVTAFVQVQNAGDKKYSDLLGSAMPGRWTTAGINISY
ncbi:MAG: TonB-dependent receptor [Chitinophagaceae bacterium]|nr:MAG: TonB-dependent receptor [Chitinophagaceae bacterium]